jgi:hypothetical protein
MSIFDSNILDYVFVGWLCIEGAIAMVMLYNYYIKPYFSKGKIKHPKGLYGTFDYWDPETGIYNFTIKNVNLSKLMEDVVAKLTGIMPKHDVNANIQGAIGKAVQDSLKTSVDESIDKDMIKRMIQEKVKKEMERQMSEAVKD